MAAVRGSKPAGRVLLLLLGLMLLLAAGCWDRTEINDLAMITATGIDKTSEKTIRLSVQVFIPRSPQGQQGMGTGGAGGGSGGQTFVRSAEGVTLADAMSRLQEKLPRLIFWGHNEVFVFGRELAEAGIRDSMDFMMRHPQVREGAYVFVSANSAGEMLELLPPLERSSSEVLRELAKSKVALGVTLKDLRQWIIGDSGAAALPWIEKLPSEQGKTVNDNAAYISGTAVLKRDKLVGHLDDKVTRGLLWLRNEIKTSIVTVSPEEADGVVSMKLLRARTELVPSIEDGSWRIIVRGETEDDIVQNGTNLDLMDPKWQTRLEAYLEKDIEKYALAALKQAQKTKADIFGFATVFHRKYPKEWNNVKDRWDEIFPKVNVTVEVKANVRRPGMSTLPAGVQTEEVSDE